MIFPAWNDKRRQESIGMREICWKQCVRHSLTQSYSDSLINTDSLNLYQFIRIHSLTPIFGFTLDTNLFGFTLETYFFGLTHSHQCIRIHSCHQFYSDSFTPWHHVFRIHSLNLIDTNLLGFTHWHQFIRIHSLTPIYSDPLAHIIFFRIHSLTPFFSDSLIDTCFSDSLIDINLFGFTHWHQFFPIHSSTPIYSDSLVDTNSFGFTHWKQFFPIHSFPLHRYPCRLWMVAICS